MTIGCTSTSNTSCTYSQLWMALNQAIAADSSSALPLYQSLFAQSKSESSNDAAVSQTYDAKGLLTALKFATNLSDPLLQSEDASEAAGPLGNTTSSKSPNALYTAIDAAGNGN